LAFKINNLADFLGFVPHKSPQKAEAASLWDCSFFAFCLATETQILTQR
jgi:hypothetical protein